MLEEIREIAQEYTQSNIELNTNIREDLGLTSFDIVSLIGEIEEKYDVEITEDDLLKVITIEDLIKCVESKK